jgi:uncharacterized LabA/DUF88 family protein
MNKTAVFVDITDIYYRLVKKFGSGKLDYAKYLAIFGPNISTAVAYGCQEDNEAGPFIKYLRSIGFITRYKRPYTLKISGRDIKRCSWLVGMAVDVFSCFSDDNKESMNHVVLGTSNPDIIPLIKFLTERGIDVTVISCNIPPSIQKVCTTIEITEDLLEKTSETN